MWIKSKSERLKAQRAKEFRRAHADPLTPRHWHDRVDFYQSNALEAAVMKRRRRAEKLERNTMSSSYHNPCLNGRISNLNPFYVAK